MASTWGKPVAQHAGMIGDFVGKHRFAKQLLAGTAISFGALMIAAPTNAFATERTTQSEIAQASAVFDFNIGAQSLNNALLDFAQQTGIQVFYDTAQVENLTSTAVTGRMQAATALEQLLDGSNVSYRFSNENSVTLAIINAADDTLVDPVLVEAQANNPGDPAATEGTNSLTTTVASVGSKGNETIRELPQSVSVVTAKRIEDQNFQYLDDAMRYTTGVQVLTNNNGRSSIYSRGYEIDNVQTNGVPAPYSSLDGTSPNLAMYDRIEVLRGPAGLYGGSGEPSATINLVRKQARDELSGSASVGYGSWNHYSGQGDVSVPLTEDGSVRARAILSADYRESFVDVVENNNELGYGTLDIDVNDDTFLSVGLSHEHKDMVPSNALPTFSDNTLLDVSTSTFVGAKWNTFDNTSDDVYLDLKHQFSSDTEGKISARYSVRNVNMKYAYTRSAAAADYTAQFYALDRHVDEDAFSTDAYLNHDFDMLGYTQTVTVGSDFRYSNQDLAYSNQLLGSYSIFNNDLPEPNNAITNSQTTESSQFGTYGKIKLQTFDDVTFSFGGRSSWYNSIVTNNLTGADTSNVTEDAVFVPFAGVVYDVTDDFSTYFSYTSIFEPQNTTTTVNGEQIEPRTGKQYEVGLKGEHFGGLMNTHLSLFQIEDQNRAAQDPSNTSFSIASGEIRTRGVEAEISGEIFENLQGFLSYTYLDSKDIDQSDSDSYSSYAPKHYVTSWADYSFDQGNLDGLSIGGGVTWSDHFSYNNGVKASSYTVVDGRIGYEINDNLALALNANNILDEKYYSRVATFRTFNFYGPSRSFFLNLTGKF
ncbi:TonB-dependent siderophore receptor [Thalassospira alkalitolerans]|uniref:TonB-dependent siderophore receptor n=1 Tax=Thalassospira alkalitolerans TaxID=1293890 RepID=UPI003AA8565E